MGPCLPLTRFEGSQLLLHICVCVGCGYSCSPFTAAGRQQRPAKQVLLSSQGPNARRPARCGGCAHEPTSAARILSQRHLSWPAGS